MKRFSLLLLFFTLFQVICVIIAYEFYWIYKLTNGGVNGSMLQQIHWLVLIPLFVEFYISTNLVYSEYKKNRT